MWDLTIKYTEENTSSKLMDIGLKRCFGELDSKSKGKKAKINKWDYIKLKSFCTAKGNMSKQKGNQLNERRYF